MSYLDYGLGLFIIKWNEIFSVRILLSLLSTQKAAVLTCLSHDI